MKEKKIGIIDLGSNSVRMTITKINSNKAYKMIDQAKEMVRLSEDMGEDKTLKPIAIERTIHALKTFKKILDIHKVDKVYAIATAAVRSAANQKAFLEQAKAHAGFKFDVISGKKEAYYDYLGVINTINISDCVIIDVGGASTEIAWVMNRRLKKAVSIPMGCVVLSEKFLSGDIISAQSLQNMNQFINEQLDDIKWLKKIKDLPIVGLGGTARALAKNVRKKNLYLSETLHGYTMPTEDIIGLFNNLALLDFEQRKNIIGVGKDRADIIVGGVAPIVALIERIEASTFTVSGNGLREGVFFSKYLQLCGRSEDFTNAAGSSDFIGTAATSRSERDDVMDDTARGGVIKDVALHSVVNMLKNYDINLKHSYHVQRISLYLFDSLNSLHNMGIWERRLLEIGSLLHDVGMHVDFYNHHNHGFYLVMNTGLNGLADRELLMCAFITAMHSEIKITAPEKDFKDQPGIYENILSKQDYVIIKKLALLVRIAEALDRGEYGLVKDLKCVITNDTVEIILKADNVSELEIEAAMKSGKAFEKLFNRKFKIH